MKKVSVLIAFAALLATAHAQTCEEILLPYFGGDASQMEGYPQYKLDALCEFGRAALYESDTIPVGADLYSITAVYHMGTGEALPANYVVDLRTLTYYAYNFELLQLEYPHGDKTICFSTPSSEYPYLVLRSMEGMHAISAAILQERDDQGYYDEK